MIPLHTGLTSCWSCGQNVYATHGCYSCRRCDVAYYPRPGYIPNRLFTDPDYDGGRFIDHATTWAPTP